MPLSTLGIIYIIGITFLLVLITINLANNRQNLIKKHPEDEEENSSSVSSSFENSRDSNYSNDREEDKNSNNGDKDKNEDISKNGEKGQIDNANGKNDAKLPTQVEIGFIYLEENQKKEENDEK